MDLIVNELIIKLKLYKKKYNNLLNNYNNLINKSNTNSTHASGILKYLSTLDSTSSTTLNNNKCIEKDHPTILQDIKLPNDLYYMSNIVDYIINESGSIKMFNPKSSILDFEKKVNVTESKDVEFRNKMTDFINNEFFNTDKLLYNFIKNFMELMNKTLDEYIQKKTPKLKNKYSLQSSFTLVDNVIFILKGGNTLKAIMEKYISKQAGIVSEYIHEIYGRYFKRSDLDFQLIIYPFLTGDDSLNRNIYNEIVEDLKILSCYVLNRFRNSFLSKLSDTFGYYKSNINTKHKLLKKLLEDLNNGDFFNKIQNQSEKDKFIEKYGEENKHYLNMKFTNINFDEVNSNDDIMNNLLSIKNDSSKTLLNEEILNIINNQLSNELINSRRDLFIEVDTEVRVRKMIDLIYGNIDKEIQNKLFNNKDNRSEFYISLMENLVYGTVHKLKGIKRRSFSLARLKVNFLVNLETTDNKYGIINIPSELIDISIAYFDDHKIKSGFAGRKQIKDLYTKYDFSNSNVEKFSFWSYNIASFIHDLHVILFDDVSLPWNDNKYEKRLYRILFFSIIQILSKRNEEINEFIKDLNTLKDIPLNIIISDKTIFDNFIQKYKDNNYGFIHVLEEHQNIFEVINDDPANKSSNDIECNKYYKIIFENIDYLNNIILKLEEFINLPYKGKVNVEEADFNKLHQFAGYINHNKYLKYKNKYLQSKKK
jgi:hypothetical protein